MTTRFLFLFLTLSLGIKSLAQKDSSFQQKEVQIERTAYTRIAHQEIEANYGKTLVNLLNEQAGIVVNGAYQPVGSFTNMYMEGCLGGKVLILLNGIPVWDPSSIPDAYFDLNFISLNEIEEIIIYRGAQSTFYGSGAMAGAISIITKRSDYKKPINLSASIGWGNKASKEVTTKLWGAKNKFNYNFSYSTFKTTGFSYAQDTTGKNNYDKDGFKNNIYNTRLEYKPTNNLSLVGYYLNSKYKADSDEEDFIDTKNFYYTNTIINKGLELNYKKSNYSLLANYNICNSIRDYHYSTTNSEYIKGTAKRAAITIKASLCKNTSLTIGADYRNGQFYNTFYDSVQGTSQNIYPSTYQYGGYAAINYQNKDSAYTLSVGARRNNCKQMNAASSFFINNTYQFNKSISVFANLGTGFLTPSIYQYSDNTIGNNSLSNETMRSGQLGVVIATNTTTHKLSFFHNNLSNRIDFNSNTSAYANCYSLKSGGIEYETQLHLTPHFLLSGNYTFLTGNETTISRQNYSDTVNYSYLIRRPKHTVNARLTYKSTNGNYISLSARCVSNYYEVGNAANDSRLNGYIVFNLNSSLSVNNFIKLNLGIQNLTNTTFHDTRGYNSIPLLFNLSGVITL